MRDDEDRQLEALFRELPIPDDGFSERVTKRVHRRVWVRRLTLPLAAVIGAAIAAKPAMDLLALLPLVAQLLPQELKVLPPDLLEHLPALFSSGLLAAAMLLAVRLAD